MVERCWILLCDCTAPLCMWSTILLLLPAANSAQNVVSSEPNTATLKPITLTDKDFLRVIEQVPARRRSADNDNSPRLRRKLEEHVEQFVKAFPYQAFQHTLGISNYEIYFNHPDEMFYALSTALPFLSPSLAHETKAFLERELARHPPCSIEGYRNEAGANRAPYALPSDVRIRGVGRAKDAFGIYALWAYCHYSDDAAAAERTWPEVKARIAPLVNQPYDFDIYGKDYTHDEAEHLNADLAGLIGYLRLARMAGDKTALDASRLRCRELLERRINLERVNSALVNPTHSTTSHLHVFKLARYVDLVPSVGRCLREHAPVASARLREFRAERETWYMAFGDRLIGGENYTNPPHFARSLFAAGVFIEQIDADKLTRFVDVPWCEGDLYFVEKAASAVWVAAGRRWETLDSQGRQK